MSVNKISKMDKNQALETLKHFIGEELPNSGIKTRIANLPLSVGGGMAIMIKDFSFEDGEIVLREENEQMVEM